WSQATTAPPPDPGPDVLISNCVLPPVGIKTSAPVPPTNSQYPSGLSLAPQPVADGVAEAIAGSARAPAATTAAVASLVLMLVLKVNIGVHPPLCSAKLSGLGTGASVPVKLSAPVPGLWVSQREADPGARLVRRVR